jgi:hypothetical protein
MKKANKIKPKTIQIAKGLTWSQAYKIVSIKLAGTGYDFRGLTYSPNTGKAKVT